MTEQMEARRILDVMRSKGYATFEDRHPYDLNIFGIRSRNTMPNRFDDVVGVVFRTVSIGWCCETWSATTDPGTYWLDNPGNVNGTAILVPGQYRGVYSLDLHRGAYEALCQRNGPVQVWRDNDRDGELDFVGPEYSGYFGINIHRASSSHTSTQVDKWSAGCQVIANPEDFARLIELCKLQIEHHPTWTKFTYTLLEEADFDGHR